MYATKVSRRMPNAMAEIIRLTFGKFPSNLIHSTTVLHLGRNVWLDLFLGETVTILLDTFHVQYLTSLWVLLAFTRLDIQPLIFPPRTLRAFSTRNLTDTEIPLLNKEHPALSVLSGGAGYFYV